LARAGSSKGGDKEKKKNTEGEINEIDRRKKAKETGLTGGCTCYGKGARVSRSDAKTRKNGKFNFGRSGREVS